MIVDHNFLGDAVSFDTTYQTNKEYRPFDIFVEMNNHRRMVIFGADLLYATMSKAISIVMPELYY